MLIKCHAKGFARERGGIRAGAGELILKERERLKKMAIINRRNEYQKSKLTTNQKNLLSLNYKLNFFLINRKKNTSYSY